MSYVVKKATDSIRASILSAVEKAGEAGQLTPSQAELPAFIVEIPGDTSHGDFATNAAMVFARTFRMAPRKIAEILTQNIALDGYLDRVEIAGPGFINFFVNPQYYADVLLDVSDKGENYGRSDYGKGEKVMVEFVSANPTGPMHIGNARGGALGDVLASVLDMAGYNAYREFYVNDAGNQIEKFGMSLEARYLQIYKGEDQIPFPEDGYHGADIKERAQQFADQEGEQYVDLPSDQRRAALVAFALPKNVEGLKADLGRYRIEYDNWFHESLLHEDGELTATINLMKEKGLTYEKEGALWYKATEHGGEKDEVLIRQNGNPTYFAADIAYHYNKFAVRGFDRCINVWGADHHGHVARLKGALDAIGLDGSKLDIVLMQLVHLMQDGEPVRVSKRTGKSITLSTLLDEIPVDAARFFFNMREANTQMDFDLTLAVEQSSQNPVYYVQYAHARICSILKNLAAEGITPRTCSQEELMMLNTPEELELIRHLASLTGTIVDAAKAYDPARITRYVTDLATLFHKFYNSCRVKGENEPLMQARLSLCLAVRQVVANILRMLKISAPQVM
ncbi:arginine--tRNA ligase [Solibaculum mannosilyticum]|uniref:Arginine--tRNA ligase n=1 Tax=Solibaculum mannosilyticum TaxID=2780922 RepID=A0A7I8D1R6_9FIRM|nr:arginine--tRNA ligase [Solibaculum mannosilyticum]BCI60758.1 arginine--tRNA ligase [Solibaculum mannosilyticum]